MTKHTSDGSTKTGSKTKANSRGTVMKSHTGEAEGLRDLFEDQLKDIYWAEKALTKAIPKMIKKATSQDLIDALEEHLEITEQQVARCEEVFEVMSMKPVASKCEAMEGLVKEATEVMDSTMEGSVRDAGIIATAQKVEHYEIATYGTLAAFAKQLGMSKAASLLARTLNEEKEADTKLSQLAESHINQEAEMENV